MRRLNLRPSSFISEFVGVDRFSKSFSLSASVSLSLGDMITAAPHQSPAAVICPTFNVNTSGCHGEAGRAAPCEPTFFPIIIIIRHLKRYVTLCFPPQRPPELYTTRTYYLCQSNTPDTTSIQWVPNFPNVMLVLISSCPRV